MLRLSQGFLNLLETCPRKFQYSVLEQLSPPATESQQGSLEWGNRFHLLMQQSQLQLPVEALLGEQIALRQAFEALHRINPQLAMPSGEALYDSEHLRSFCFQGKSFSVVYDLLITTPAQAQILDWKTYPKPIQAKTLSQDWQTRLYCYGLVETSDYSPEQVSMTYWFVRGKGGSAQPESLKIQYNSQQHRQIAVDLGELMTQLEGWIKQYSAGSEFPQIEPDQGKCDRCSFFSRCRGQWTDGVGDRGALDLTAIAEVSL